MFFYFVIVINCGNPDDPDPNGDVTYVATTFGNTANYSCDIGYLLDVSQGGSVVVTCLASSVWSDHAPACACKKNIIILINNSTQLPTEDYVMSLDGPIMDLYENLLV